MVVDAFISQRGGYSCIISGGAVALDDLSCITRFQSTYRFRDQNPAKTIKQAERFGLLKTVDLFTCCLFTL